MLQPNTLRIGNYVQIRDTGEIGTVALLSKAKYIFNANSDAGVIVEIDGYEGKRFSYDDLKGIELTNQNQGLTAQFGNDMSHSDGEHIALYSFPYGHFDRIIRKPNGEVLLAASPNHLLKVSYLHEIQNIYSDFTGFDLVFKQWK